MALEIYWGSGSPFAWRVLLALEFKRLAYESHCLQFSKREHKTPDFLAMNPRGKVPVLKDGDFVVYESLAIMKYLDDRFPEPSLFGREARRSATIMTAICEVMSYVEQPIIEVVRPVFFGGIDEHRDRIIAAGEKLREEFALINARLSGHAWLAGADVSAADFVLFPLVAVLLRALAKASAAALDLRLAPLAGCFPAMAQWVTQIEGLAGFDRTYPPHWRE